MKTFYKAIIGCTAACTLLSTPVFAQQREGNQRDTVAKRSAVFFRKRLHIDSAKAEQVGKIQDDYKKGVGLVMDNKGLTEDQKRKAVEALMQEKNSKLEILLTPQQQELIIPTTERHEGKGAEKKKHN